MISRRSFGGARSYGGRPLSEAAATGLHPWSHRLVMAPHFDEDINGGRESDDWGNA